MKTILLTNDDGFMSPGIQWLKKNLEKKYSVYMVAPDRERSAISMALTLNYPLRIQQIEERVFTVNGTPVDCVNIAVQRVLPHPADFVISGMNLGENLGEDVFFSGTIGGAFSAFLYNIPAMAVSLIPNNYQDAQYPLAEGARITERILDKLLEQKRLHLVYNINIPHNPTEQIKVTRLGSKRYRPDIVENTDPRGRKYYWIGTGNPEYIGEKGTDIWAYKNRFISLSILNFNLAPCDGTEKLSAELEDLQLNNSSPS